MALLPILNDYKEIEVVGIADVRSDAPGLAEARKLGIPTSSSYRELLSEVDADVIVNVTGSEEVSAELREIKDDDVEILEGLSSNLLFKLVAERKRREQEILRSLQEQQMLYKIGLMLTSSEKEEEMLSTIVECAISLVETPAGSIALYDEADGTMEMVAYQGFSKKFSKKTRWTVKKGGLTDHILNQDKAVVISDMSKFEGIDRPAIVAEGIQSLIAIPLVSDRKTIGILYVDDFKPRTFTKKDESTLALLATQASVAIDKLQLLERTKKLAITDELTSLYNHRYFVNALSDEVKRSKRLNRSLSVIMIDIDHFKHYNDTHGHLKGNEVLKEVSSVMLKRTRKMDTLARYGGRSSE